ncbi:hypothetical protein J4H86_06580 [Spiractinospora alimapuensis]|uniref:hypothetical protein n=1 Tax=Spiractinospora alimapuensis TaxID=2820884 RepID=UPI001F261746|nr:hypothetical protein [Spiractinospora alimapuensis]QVQ53419.1 hypothetical protein J4H86_06580 [Spiractinospora alimapuensis]
MRAILGLPTLMGAALLVAGCGSFAPPEPSPPTPEEPVELPSEDADIRAGFEELSELTIPDDAEDVDITVEHSGAGTPLYRVGFITDAEGLEEFCNADNFSPYTLISEPDEEERERFEITEETVDGMVHCRGSGVENHTDREVIAVWPEEDVAAVHGIVWELPG